MKFRFKAFGLHLLGSAAVLSLVLGGLYLGWYRWPGWYLTDALHILVIVMVTDLVVGPTLTFLVANPAKPRRIFARDVGVILVVQLTALIYGATTLWLGRPIYYAFSVDCLQIVQASDISCQRSYSGAAAKSVLGTALVQSAAMGLGAASSQSRRSGQDSWRGHPGRA